MILRKLLLSPHLDFEFPFMSFGLPNAAQSFQRFMDEVFRDLDLVFPYLDDAIIAVKDEVQHEQYLRAVFERLRDYGVVINTAKSVFGVSEIVFLGFLVTAEGTKPTVEKVRAILEISKTNNIKELRRFLGMLNFYRRFISKAARIQAPLHQLFSGKTTTSKTPIIWTDQLEQSFNAPFHPNPSASELALLPISMFEV